MRLDLLSKLCAEIADNLTATFPDYTWTVLPDIDFDAGFAGLMVFTTNGAGNFLAARPGFPLEDIDSLITDTHLSRDIVRGFEDELADDAKWASSESEWYPTSPVKVWVLRHRGTAPREYRD